MYSSFIHTFSAIKSHDAAELYIRTLSLSLYLHIGCWKIEHTPRKKPQKTNNKTD